MISITKGSRGFYIVSTALLILLGIGFGLSFPLTKMALEAVGPGTFIFWQTLGAGLILAFILQVRRQLLPIPPAFWFIVAITASLGFVLPNVLFNFALNKLPAGLSAVAIATSPFFAYGLALAFRSEALNLLRLAGIALGFSGVLCLILPQSAMPSPDLLPYFLLCLLPPAAYAGTNYFLERKMPEGANPLQYTALNLLVAAAFVSPLYFWESGGYLPNYTSRGDTALVAAIVLSAFNFAALFTLVAWRGAVFTSQVGNVVTVAGLIWAYFIFGETLTAWLGLAVILILAGVSAVTLTRR